MNTHLILALLIGVAGAEPPKGKLVAVGGGGTTPEIISKMMELAGGKSARMLLVPYASSEPAATGTKAAASWKEEGFHSVDVLKLNDPKAALEQVRAADLIWMGGGDQVRLVKALAETEIPQAIRERFRAGAVVGGTSAGAAALSSPMIFGGEDAELRAVKVGGTKVVEGLGLWPNAILDQHFIKRARFNRLLSAVLTRPELVGIGIDESTAAILSGTNFEVVGKGQVVVIDARKAKVQAKGEVSAGDVRLTVLSAGMSFDLDAPPSRDNSRRP